MSKAAVVILNWNGKDFLEKFLPAVIQHTPSFADVFVADNGSSDNSVDFIKKNFFSVKIIQNKTNSGYAKGYNDALKNVDAEYFVLLNSDIEVTPNWLQPIIEMMDKDKSIGACQPKILSFNNKKQFEYAGAAGGFIDKYGYAFCRGRIFNSFEEDNGQYNDEKEIFWATGACLFVRSKIFWEAGALDEDFFAHMEEIDLCWRMKNMGYKIMYCPRSGVYHVGGGTLSKISPKKTFLNFRNNLILLCKNHSSEYFKIKLLLRLKLDGIAGFKFLLSGDFGHFLAVIKAHWSFFSTIAETLRKRRAMKKRIAHYTTSAVYKKSIAMDYFLRGKKKFSDLDKKLL